MKKEKIHNTPRGERMSKTKTVSYVLKNGLKITLRLTGAEYKFFCRVQKAFRANRDWLEFDDFFAPKSPIYNGYKSHLEVLKDPLYLALKDMWLRLGIKQGHIRAK